MTEGFCLCKFSINIFWSFPVSGVTNQPFHESSGFLHWATYNIVIVLIISFNHLKLSGQGLDIRPLQPV